MSHDAAKKLKPCPFCGSAAYLQQCPAKGFRAAGTRITFQVGCMNRNFDECPLRPSAVDFTFPTEQAAIEAWNKRAQSLDARPAVAEDARVDQTALQIAIDYENEFMDAKDDVGKYRPKQTTALALAITAYANQRGDERWREGVTATMTATVVALRDTRESFIPTNRALEIVVNAANDVRALNQPADKGDSR